MSAVQDMIDGYFDGYTDERADFPTESNRSRAYRHGWLNGRDDRTNSPRATAAELRAVADEIIREDGE